MAKDFSDWKPYEYTPSKAAAAIACVLFGLATLVMLVQFIMGLISKRGSKSSKRLVLTLIPFLIGGFAEFIGYIGRIMSGNDTKALGPYIMQSTLLLVAPALFAATIYMTLGRIIYKMDCEHLSLIPLKWLTKIFVIGDVLSFLMQGSGGGLMAKSNYDIGEKLVIIGLFVQIGFFGLFIIVMGLFQYRVLREPSSCSITLRYQPSKYRNWQMIIVTLFLCSVLIFVRSIVRVVEYLQGQEGYIISHEVFLYLLDGLPMFLNMLLFCFQDIALYYTKIFLWDTNLLVQEQITEPFANEKSDVSYRKNSLV